MGPGSTRKSRSVNKQYTYINGVSLSKDGEGAKRSNIRKRKLSDLLGHRWTQEELTRFYEAYRRHGKDWKKVAAVMQNRSSEMVEALYKMNRAYLSLPDGTASAAGMVAMMIDYYINLEGSDSDQESNDGAGSSQKTQKRARGNIQPTTTSKASDEQFALYSQTIESSYDCLSLVKKECSGGTRTHPVGKRTPRFPVSFIDENIKREKGISPTNQGLKIKANDNDDEVAREIAIVLAEASQKGCSTQVFRSPSKRAESVISSPFRHDHRKHSVAEMGNPNLFAAEMDKEDLEGSRESDTGKLSRYKPYIVESVNCSMAGQKGRKLAGKKYEVDNNDENDLNDIKEECSGTEEGERFGSMGGKFDIEVTDAKSSIPSMQNQRKKSKKVLFRRDEGPTFDALQTLADFSLMMPTENEDGSRVLLKDEIDDHVDESLLLEALPMNQQKGKRRSSGVRMKGHKPISSFEVASSKTSKPGKGLAVDGSYVSAENRDPHQPIPKTTRKKQKIPASMIQKAEAHPDIHLCEYPRIEAGNAGTKFVSKSKKSSQNSSPKMIKNTENFSSADLQEEGSHPDQSATQVPAVTEVNFPTNSRRRRKMDLKRQLVQKDLKFSDKILNNECNLPFTSSHDAAFNFKEKLSSCLSNQRLRKWCAHEWFYNAIDYPWFAKKEFVEYLNHVGLGHVPRLTRVEWGVIRSSLGKPRRFSEQFLKEEKDKLYQYRDSVRKHYIELREGVRSSLPADLARPLSVGQRVIAIHPKTREIHDGSVLTIDSSKYRVQFDRHDLGVEFVMDIDCMPTNLLENKPALFEKEPVAVDKFFENFNELKINGQPKEYMVPPTGDNLDNIYGISHLSPLANPTRVMKKKKVASSKATAETRIGPSETATYQQTACSQQSTLVQIQAKEADVQALAELTRGLDKKRHMNGDVMENQKDGNSSLKDSEPFRKKYAAILLQLIKANEQVSSALYCLRQRNTYQGNSSLEWPRPVSNVADPAGPLSFSDLLAFQTQESGSPVTEAIDISTTKARTMVVAAMQAISSLKIREATVEKFEEAIDNVNDQLPSDDSCMPAAPDSKLVTASDPKAKIPSQLIAKCVATLLMIQKCTRRQFPPADVAQILDFAVTSLHPLSSQNLSIYTEIQQCMGIIRNQIMALIPT